MPTTDPAGDYDLIARIHDWLTSLWTNPEAAAQFAENPTVSLASNNLSQDALNSVNLRHIAGDVANAPGIPDGGRNVLHSFANSPGGHSSNANEVYHVTREVHHDQPIIQRIFEDNSTHIDNSTTFVNRGIIDGDVDLSNNSSIAIGDGAVSASGEATVNAATGAGAVANQGSGDVNQADGQSQIIDGSEVGQNSSNSAGSAQVGGDADGALNTGSVDGTQSGGGATGNVVGDSNETATVGSSAEGTNPAGQSEAKQADGQEHPDGSADGSGIAFGQGAVGTAAGNGVGGDGAATGLGTAQNQSHADLNHGSALGGVDASGQNEEDDSLHVDAQNETLVDDSSNVDLSQDHSESESDQHLKPLHVEADHSNLAGDDIDHTALHA
jgi:hypothetical protein